MKRFFVATVICAVSLFLFAAVTTAFAQTLTTLHNFTGPDGDGPTASLILARTETTTAPPSWAARKRVARSSKSTPSGSFSVLYNFCSQPQCDDGSAPYAGLVQGRDGNFYGTTAKGGTGFSGDGTAFKVTPAAR